MPALTQETMMPGYNDMDNSYYILIRIRYLNHERILREAFARADRRSHYN